MDLEASVVRILKPDGRTAGTGFVVSDEGLVVTCSHVVEAAGAGPGERLRLEPHGGPPLEALILADYWPPVDDIALLQLEGPLPQGVKAVPLGTSQGSNGHDYQALGYPQDGEVQARWPQGKIGGLVPVEGWQTDLLQLQGAEVDKGLSGAPVLDLDTGWVVGMIAGYKNLDRTPHKKVTRLERLPNAPLVRYAYAIPTEAIWRVCPLPAGEPYRSLQVFEAEHADLYFGREAAIKALLGALAWHDAVLLVGVSGSGKSSLVRAGLEKGLRRRPAPGLADLVRCLAVPGRHPLFNLVLALAELPDLGPEAVAQAFELPPEALTQKGESRRRAAKELDRRALQALAAALSGLAPPPDLLIIVDQLERLYTECPDKAVQDRFIEALLTAASDRVKVLLALRADFYGLALAHESLERIVRQDGQVTLGQMTADELRAAIEEPARAMGRSLAPGLVERLSADVQGRAGDLPLLEFALTELWERDNQQGVLTLATYEALGYELNGQRFPGVRGVIARRAETVWKQLDAAEQQIALRVFLNLVTPGRVDERGKRLAEDASRRAWQVEWDEATRRVAGKLVEARLLTTGQDPVSGQPTVEVAHEALIRAWPRLREWLKEYGDFVRWYNHLAPFLHRWQEQKQHPDFLLPEATLPQAQNWLAQYPDLLAGPAAKYVRTSVEKAEREQKARERRRRLITVGLAVGLVLTLALALLAGMQWRRAAFEADVRAAAQVQAEARRQEAVARQLAAQALVNLESRPRRSLLLAVEAVTRTLDAGAGPTVAAHMAAQQSLRQVLAEVSDSFPLQHGEEVWDATFSPDGHWLATASADGFVRLWDMTHVPGMMNEPRFVFRGSERDVVTVAFSPTGDRLAAGSWDGTVRLWNMSNLTAHPITLPHENAVWAIAFSPDGQWLVVGCGEARTGEGVDNPLYLWDLTGPAPTKASILSRHKGTVNTLTFSPDGRWLAAASKMDDTVWLWQMGDRTAEPTPLKGHQAPVRTAAFSPDGRWLATGDKDGETRLWDMLDPTAESILIGDYGDAVKVVAFSPDGRWLATGGRSGQTRLWNLNALTTSQPVELDDHQDPIRDMTFSPDGHWLATGSADKTIHLRNMNNLSAKPLLLRGHDGFVKVVTFSPEGRWLASASWDGTARLWDITHLTVEPIIRSHPPWCDVLALAISPDGHWLVTGTGCQDTPVQLWDMTSLTAEPEILPGHPNIVYAVAFSSDGRQLATGSEDNLVRLCELSGGAPGPVTQCRTVGQCGDTNSVLAVTFSPDGQWLAAGSGDGSACLWSIDSLTSKPYSLPGYTGAIHSLAFSPDGSWLATGSGDERACLWNMSEIALLRSEKTFKAKPIELPGYRNAVFAVAFSPSGRWLVTGDKRKVVDLWDVTRLTEPIKKAELYGHEGSVKTVAFRSDGHWLATGSRDKTIRLWNMDDLGGSVVLHGHQEAVEAMAFSPDGKWLVTGSRDDTVRLWRMQLDELIEIACRIAGRNLTFAEWQQYIGDEPYRATCPNLPVPEE